MTMAEGISVAASAIAVRQITNSFLSVCYDYYAAVRGPSELSRVLKELEDLRTILQHLESIAKEAESSNPAQLQNLTQLCLPDDPLGVCLNELRKLEAKLKSPDWMKNYGRNRTAIAQRLRWLLKEGETKKSLDTISRAIGTLQSALVAHHTYSSLPAEQEALDITPADHPNRAGWLHNLGIRYRDRYQRTGKMADLETAMRRFQQALDITPADHPNRAGRLHNLGIGYHDRYQKTGAMTDLDTAIRRFQEALDITPTDHPNRASRLHNLEIGYHDRYQKTGAMIDIDIAIQPFQKALDTTSADHSALPEPSSEFVDSAYGTASNGQGIHHKTIGSVELVSEEQAADDTRTEYSELSEASFITRTYLEDLADELFSVIYTPQTDSKHMHRLCGILTDLLQQFAFRIGLEVPSKEGREVMYYVYRNRRRIVELFEQKCSDKNVDEECSVLIPSDTVPVQEKVLNWFTQEDDNTHLSEEAIVAFPDEPELEIDDERSQVDRYRELVSRTSAYSWLLAIMRRELAFVTQKEYILDSIRNEINRSFPSVPKISARRQPDVVTSLFRVNWDLAAFIVEQEYSEDKIVAMEEAITLTGSLIDAQALPCIQYLRQTWPLSGEYTFRLLQKLMDSEYGESSQVNDKSDPSKLIAWRTLSAIYIEVSGSRSSIIEIGEQLAWLGGALRTSPFTGLASCIPYVDTCPLDQDEYDELFFQNRQDSNHVLKIDFIFDKGSTDPENHIDGRCWHNLFRNPTVVQGFPILRRESICYGLEIPLNMMAGLVGTARAHVFNNITILKGFSSMLVPSRQFKGVIVWHLLFSVDGSRISYLEYEFSPLQETSFQHLQISRHIVGWCSQTKNHAGGREANYNIERSRLPPLSAGAVLEKASINAGKYVTAGLSFSIGVKDIPVHVPRKSYPQKLRWLLSKFFVFWDTEEKRGWLINGISALLHIVRATLKHYETDTFRSKLLSKCHDILEPSFDTVDAYSITVLLDENNMKLPIYAAKDDVDINKNIEHDLDSLSFLKRKKRFYRLEDRVEELYEVLEKLIDHQIDKAGQAGWKMKAHARRHLEGWDFKDLVSDKDPIYPRGETLHAIGKGWVDFIRCIQAVTLFGKGFGEIIQSRYEIDCPHWKQMPKEKFYLAACVSDLQQIMEMEGDNTTNPMKLCHGISWFSPSAAFDACPCTKTQNQSHSDLVQMLWPTSLTKLLPKQKKVHLYQEGAVIFGHNAKIRWKWGDTGDPMQGDPSLELTEYTDNLYNDAAGFAESSSSRQHNQITPSDSATADNADTADTADTSLQQLQKIEASSEEITPKPNEPIDDRETIYTERDDGRNPSLERLSLFHRMKKKIFR